MRNTFADEITKLGGTDPRLVMLSADIGNRLFDTFKGRHQGRFLNCGVAEANMISMAAGLASCGMRPVCYTITPFITARCYEQIKVDVCYHGMPVVIVGTGSGLSYASLGTTHHSLEDVALMRTLPGMRVLAPADSHELRTCLREALSSDTPVYIRIGKKGEPAVHEAPPPRIASEWLQLNSGTQVALLSSGTVLPEVREAARILADRGVSSSVLSCACIKPLDEATLARLANTHSLLVTIEEHYREGGLGSAVAERLLELRGAQGASLLRLGVADRFLSHPGEQDQARRLCGLDAAGIAERVSKALNP